jgi:hypothetical protein
MPRPESEWFPGPYHVLAGIERLEQHPFPAMGEIVARTGKNIAIMRCPACQAIQFFVVEVTGPADSPTFSRPTRCSAASCRDCGVWFRVVNGRVGSVEPPVKREVPIPEALRGRIHSPPRVE